MSLARRQAMFGVDATFTCVTAALWVVLLAAYRLRVARFGSFESDRVLGIGGTALVGQDIMQATYWAIDPIVRGLATLGVTANMVTWAALALGLGGAVAIANGMFGLACLLATLSTISDILDGQVARVTSSGSARGELLDAAVDRYTEFAFIAGFIVYAHESPVLVAIALCALLASFMISYASAKAEALAVTTPRGLMRRHERAVFLILFSGLQPLLGPIVHGRWSALPESAVFAIALVLVGVIGNYAAIQRFVRISRQVA
jgi:CDP-diacylglycerol--glycerol-3-phosphate 3-phosphatidyltransferase